MVAHIFASILLLLAVPVTFMSFRLVLEFALRDMDNKYPAWIIASGVLWAAFYLCH